MVESHPALASQIQNLAWVQDGLSDLERSTVDELLYMATEDVANLEAVLQLPWVQDDISETEYELLDFLGVLDTPDPANLNAALNIPWVQDGGVSAYITNNMRWLARNFPALFLEIHMLPWVEDGFSDLERSAVDELLYMAIEDVANLEAVLQLPWVQDDISETEYELLDFLGVLDTPDPANLNAALNIPWVQDGGVSAYITNNMRWLARNFPALFLEIQVLPWVEDGFSDLERSAVDELLYMAIEDVANLEAVLQLPWVQDDISETEYELLDFLGVLDTPDPANLNAALNIPWVQDGGVSAYITNNMRWLARNFPALFLEIQALPWVEDGFSDLERSAVDELLYIAVGDLDNLEVLLGLPWVQDDITETERDALEWIQWLAKNSEQAAYAINALLWVQDDITETERDALQWLNWLAHDSEQAAVTVTALPWVQDDITETERDALEWIRWLAKNSEQAATTIIALPWFQNDITETERDALQWLSWLAHDSEQAAVTVTALPWVQDNITGTERDALEWIRWLAKNSEQAATTIIALPWFQNDITEIERDALQWLSWLAHYGEKAAIAVTALPWVQDNITEIASDALRYLSYLSQENQEATTAIVAMPFLKSLEPDDMLAVHGIRRLARDDDDSLLPTLMNHPSLTTGITDAQTTLVAGVGTLADTDEIQRVLEPGVAAIETVQLGTNLTPGLKISIVRTDSQSRPGTIEATRDLVEFVEDTMGLPLPVDHVIIILNEGSVVDRYAGANFGFAFSYLPKYEQQQGTFEWQQLQLGFVHETAHYYWSGNEGWIDEGLANTVEYMFGRQNGLSRGQLQPRRDYCEAHDLAMLSEWNPDSDEWQRYRCTYYLGQLLFQELLEDMGGEVFSEKLQELYRLTLQMQDDDQRPGIAEVRQVFSGQTAIIDKHWSGKLNAPENRPFDEGVARTSHDLVEWERYPMVEGGYLRFKGRLLDNAVFSHGVGADALNEPQNFTLHWADRRESLGNILPPLPSGRTWNLSGSDSVVASTYNLNQATREFNVTFQFAGYVQGDPADYVVMVWGFQDNSRTPTISENVDLLGYARIRVEPES